LLADEELQVVVLGKMAADFQTFLGGEFKGFRRPVAEDQAGAFNDHLWREFIAHECSSQLPG